MKRDVLFFVFVATLILGLVAGIFVRGIKSESIIEQKALMKFPNFALEDFFRTDFQTNMEGALSDQIILGPELKSSYNKIKNANMAFVVKGLKKLENDHGKSPLKPTGIQVLAQKVQVQQDTRQVNNTKNLLEKIRDLKAMAEKIKAIEKSAYEIPLIVPVNSEFDINLTPRVSGLMEMDTGHLVFRSRKVEESISLFENKANNYNQLVQMYPELEFYSYYIETDADIEFVNGTIDHDLAVQLEGLLDPQINFATLTVNSPEDYQNYFYKTDHHWDVGGQYQGYKDIIRLVKGPDERLVKVETIMLPDLKYNGYKSRSLGDYTIFDQFGLLKGRLGEHETYLNGQLGQYGNKEAYEKGNYTLEGGFPYYADCNGGDYGQVAFQFNQPDEGNILVFVESFSNPINEFIASHFNNTYFVDLRHYTNDYGRHFDFGDFVQTNDIDGVLFMGYYFFYANNTFLIND